MATVNMTGKTNMFTFFDALSRFYSRQKLTFIDDGMKVPPEHEDGDEDEVEDDGQGNDDPGDDLPGVPRPSLVHGLLLLLRIVVLGRLVVWVLQGLVILIRIVIAHVYVSLHPNMIQSATDKDVC